MWMQNLSLSHLTIAGLFFRTLFINMQAPVKKNVELYFDDMIIFKCITMSQKVRIFDHECPVHAQYSD